MRKILAAILALVVVAPVGASASGDETTSQTQQDVVSKSQVLANEGPADGEFTAWTKMLYNGQQVKFYAKYPPVGKKVQFMVKNSTGIYEEFAWLRVAEDDLDANGNYQGLQNDIYFIRTFDLEEGPNRLRIYLDGEIVFGTVTYSKKDGPIGPPPEPEPEVQAAFNSQPITGAASDDLQVTFDIEGFAEQEKLTTVCIKINDELATREVFKSVRLKSQIISLDAEGCMSQLETTEDSQLILTINTKNLEDGQHELVLNSSFELTEEDSVELIELETKKSFRTDNFSLNALAPEVSINGNAMEGNKLSVNTGTWPDGTFLSYRWFSGDQEVYGVNGPTYLLTQADVGKEVKVKVIARKNSDVNEVEAATGIVEDRGATAASSGNLAISIMTYSVSETNYLDEVDLTYQIQVRYPTEVICPRSSFSCQAEIEYRAINVQGDGFFSFGKYLELTRVGASTQRSSYLFISSTDINGGVSPWDSNTVNFTSGDLVARGSTSYNLSLASAGFRETYTSSSTGFMRVIKGPNRLDRLPLGENFGFAVDEHRDGYIWRGGTSSNPDWFLFSYSFPTKMRVLSECVVIPIYASPVDLVTGTSTAGADLVSDLTLTIRDSSNRIREELIIRGGYGDWSSMENGNFRYEAKVCDLSTRRYTNETVNLSLTLSQDQFQDSSRATNFSDSLYLYGGLEWSELRCFKGEDGLTLFEANPVCPDGWTETEAEIRNGKVQFTTINCLRGTDVEVVTHPDPKCPSGYSETNLRVRDGKLVPWTITCSNGVIERRVTGVFPSCPPGLRRT